MKRIKLHDTLIQSVGYDAMNMTLEIECVNSGGIYWFSDFPDEEYYGLMSANNHREYFEEYIEGIFNSRLVEEY